MTILCGQDVYLMRIKGRPKAARNLGSLSFMEGRFLVRPDSKLEERNQRDAFLILWYNGFQKVYLSPKFKLCSYYHHWTTQLFVPLSSYAQLCFGIKTMKIRITFWMFCIQISVSFSNQTISTSIIWVHVLVGSLINIQKQNMINKLKQEKRGHAFIGERLTHLSLIVTSSWKSYILS